VANAEVPAQACDRLGFLAGPGAQAVIDGDGFGPHAIGGAPFGGKDKQGGRIRAAGDGEAEHLFIVAGFRGDKDIQRRPSVADELSGP
jgi:hypothetical protein